MLSEAKNLGLRRAKRDFSLRCAPLRMTLGSFCRTLLTVTKCKENHGRILPCQEFEFLDAEGLAQFLQRDQLDLADSFFAQAEFFADLLEGLGLLPDRRAEKAEAADDHVPLAFGEIVLDHLPQAAVSPFHRCEIDGILASRITVGFLQRGCRSLVEPASLLGNLACEILGDDPGGECGESEASGVVELLDRLHQGHIALADQVEQARAGAGVFAGDGDDKSQVRLDHPHFDLLGLSEVALYQADIFARDICSLQAAADSARQIFEVVVLSEQLDFTLPVEHGRVFYSAQILCQGTAGQFGGLEPIAGRRLGTDDRFHQNPVLGALFEEFVADYEFDLPGPERFCPSAIYDPVYRTLLPVETPHQLFDIAALLVELVYLGGLRRLDDAARLLDCNLSGIGAFVVEQRVPDRLRAPARPVGYPAYDLVARQILLGGELRGLLDDLLLLLVCEPAETARLADKPRIRIDEIVDLRLQEAEASDAIREDILSRNQAARSPARDRLCRDADSLGKLRNGVCRFGLLGDRTGQLAAQFGNEDPQVLQQLIALDEFASVGTLEIEAGNAEEYELEGILLFRIDDGKELLGGVELLSPLLLRCEAKLHQQLRQVVTCYLSHGKACIIPKSAQKKQPRKRLFSSLTEKSDMLRVHVSQNRKAISSRFISLLIPQWPSYVSRTLNYATRLLATSTADAASAA